MEWLIMLAVGFFAFVAFATDGVKQMFLVLMWGAMALAAAWAIITPLVRWAIG